MKKRKILAMLLAITLSISGCSSVAEQEDSTALADVIEDVAESVATVTDEIDQQVVEVVEELPEDVPEEPLVEEPVVKDTEEGEEPILEEASLDTDVQEEEGDTAESTATAQSNGILVVIDAGHQAVGNYDQEPIGPGATETKAKVASGTQGWFTGIPEYVLTLAVSQMLEEELLARGYDVIMVRDTHDVDISNAERAQIANENNADVFIRIHANGSEDTSVNGAFTLCPTANNPYCSEIYEASRLLSDCVLDGLIATTGAYRRSVWETDTMSGINWCTVPVTIVEMGFMTNQIEDEKMATDEYRLLLAQGMADGIDQYIASR